MTALSIIGATITAVGTLTWWLSGQFTGVRRLVHERIEHTQKVIEDKLDYHEKHDDQRFSQMNNDLWAIKVRNAAIDGAVRAKVIENKE